MFRKLIARFYAWLDEGADDNDPPIDRPRDGYDEDDLGRVW